MHTPASISEPVEPVINTLFEAARAGRLVVCAGAGLSRAKPAELPSGASLGRDLDERLEELIQGYESPPEPENLIAVADAGAGLEGGEAAMKAEVLKLARFRSAEPNFGHRALAQLICEGACQLLLLWNWDDCVERVDVTPETLQVIRSLSDLEDVDEPSIAKIHGCATRPRTLLVTSNDLQTPPLWTEQAFAERIRGRTVVFIGVGDIADYAQRRLQQLCEELGGAEGSLDVWVVSPTIRSQWGTSKWAELIPALPEERRLELSADEFLDQLTRRWVREVLDELERSTAEALSAATRSALKVVCDRLRALGGERALRWCRQAAISQEVGGTVVACDGFRQALVALATLSSSEPPEISVFAPAAAVIGDRRIEALVLCKATPAHVVRQRAVSRAEDLAGRVDVTDAATFLVSGTMWGSLSDDPAAELDITVGHIDPQDVAVGASGVRVSFITASAILEGA